MKRVKRSGAAQIWRERVEAAKSFRGSALSSCRAHNINANSFYNWRRRFAGEAEKPRSSFVPVVVHAERPAIMPPGAGLPEARWVAEVLSHFVRNFER